MTKREENEIKIAVRDAARMRRQIRAAGFQLHKARVFERNIVLDDATGSVKATGLLLRVRTAGKVVTCTFKGRELAGPHKRREEREFHADNLEECLALFAGIGFTPMFTYEKYRTEFQRGEGPGIVMVDETPIGAFLELEGPARWVDATARELGFSRDSYIHLSYGRLFEQWRNEFGADAPDNMLFPKTGS